MPFGARRLLELAFDAISDSGIDTRGRRVGCFMSGNNDMDDWVCCERHFEFELAD